MINEYDLINDHLWHINEVFNTIYTSHFTLKLLYVNIRIISCANKAYQNYTATYMHRYEITS